jgi:ADP-L-glycero-D-manno-heptose 6-epimerase
MRKAIITGTKGFIGSNLKKRLQSDFEIIEINEDIFDNNSWREDLESIIKKSEAHVFFHIGACSNTLEQDVNYMMKLNFESTKIIADVCFDIRLPLIYSSSAAVYGIDGKSPSNLYGWSKWVGECYVIEKSGIGLRYFNVYGPGEERKGKMASVAYQMFQKNKKDEEIKLFPLKPSRDFVYVSDIVSANIYAFENYYDLSGRWYEVGSGESKTFEDVLNILDIKFDYVSEDLIPKGYQFYTKSDSERWMEGWSPDYDLEKGLNEYKNYLI